jgi:hypothetical protein
MEKCVVSRSESVAIVLERRRFHWRITEARMTFQSRRPPLGNIPLRRLKSVVVAMLRNLVENRWWWSVRHIRAMRTPHNRERGKQNCQKNPLLHLRASFVEVRA